jgi:hypothetical protein
MRQQGFMLIELIISMVVLTIGLGGLLILMISAMYTDKRSGSDTASVMVAEHVLEQISAEPASSITPLQITDCTGAVLTINTAGALLNGGSGANGGNGAALTADPNAPLNAPTEVIDWTQAFANVPAGYAIQYVACGNPLTGRQETYDIRWNVITLSTYSRMVFISARPVSTLANGGLRFIMPVTLRTIEGS